MIKQLFLIIPPLAAQKKGPPPIRRKQGRKKILHFSRPGIFPAPLPEGWPPSPPSEKKQARRSFTGSHLSAGKNGKGREIQRLPTFRKSCPVSGPAPLPWYPSGWLYFRWIIKNRPRTLQSFTFPPSRWPRWPFLSALLPILIPFRITCSATARTLYRLSAFPGSPALVPLPAGFLSGGLSEIGRRPCTGPQLSAGRHGKEERSSAFLSLPFPEGPALVSARHLV